MIDCPICEGQVYPDDEATAYVAGQIYHVNCLEDFDGDLEDLL